MFLISREICYFYPNQKSISLKKYLLFSFFLLLAYQICTAQSTQEELLISDLLIVADNFVAPGAEASAVQSSAGWFSTADTLGKWQVEISIHGNALFVADNKKTRTTSNSDYSILRLQQGTTAVLPTIFGGDTEVMFEGEIFGEEFSFDALPGLNKDILIHPYPQVTVGLPLQTEIAVRFLPKTTINEVGFSTYGVGLKHHLTHYFMPSEKNNLQLAAVLTYSNFQADYAFEPADIEIATLNSIDVNADLWLLQVLGSKKLGMLELMGAVGMTLSQFDYTLGGTGGGLNILNNALADHNWDESRFKGDVGLNYHCNNFKISSMLSIGSFINANIGVHYRIR